MVNDVWKSQYSIACDREVEETMRFSKSKMLVLIVTVLLSSCGSDNTTTFPGFDPNNRCAQLHQPITFNGQASIRQTSFYSLYGAIQGYHIAMGQFQSGTQPGYTTPGATTTTTSTVIVSNGGFSAATPPLQDQYGSIALNNIQNLAQTYYTSYGVGQNISGSLSLSQQAVNAIYNYLGQAGFQGTQGTTPTTNTGICVQTMSLSLAVSNSQVVGAFIQLMMNNGQSIPITINPYQVQ